MMMLYNTDFSLHTAGIYNKKPSCR